MKIISARRAYEFGPDEIRLTSLAVPSVIDAIRGALQFQIVQVGSPQPTFGTVPATLPPGIVFNLGLVVLDDRASVPIRLLHVEPERIVIDVAGYTWAIDRVYEILRGVLTGLRAADGSPVLGEPVRVLNHSTISARLAFSPDRLLPTSLRAIYGSFAGAVNHERSRVPIPSLFVQQHETATEFPGVDATSHATFNLALRAGTLPEARHYYSAAPLDTDRHLSYLREIERVLATEDSVADSEDSK